MNPVGGGGYSAAPGSAKKTVGVSIAVCVFVSLIVGVIGFAIGTRYQYIFANGNNLDYSELNAVYATLKSKFDGELDTTKLLQGAAAGMTAAAGDPYTVFLTADDAKALTDDLSGSFEGIGAELGTNANKQLEIVSVLDDSPAKKAGLRGGDLIAKINDADSLTWTPDKAVDKIRGAAGTTVKLTIIRDGTSQDFAITRAEITNPSVKWEMKGDIGYMRISQFGTDTASLAATAAREFKAANAKGVVLDLRGDGGGYVDAAQAVASLWLKSGATIVQEKTAGVVRDTIKASGDATLLGVPTVVLIDGGSASASEIVAGALRDNGAAQLVGAKSYGKGSVQEIVSQDTFGQPLFKNGAVMKITIAKWYTPKGANINGDGLTPDVEVQMTADEFNAGNDTQLNKALDLLK
jgi:carboxyl-terminal processing protease